MATFPLGKRLLVVGGLVALIATAAVVRAADDNNASESAVDKPEQDTQGNRASDDNDPLSVTKDVSEIDQLLNQSLVTNDQLDKEVRKSDAWKYGAYGSLAAAGVGGIGSLIKTMYNAKSGSPQGKKGTALGVLLAGLVIAGAAGVTASMIKKAQADKRAREKARELLGQRQAMLSKMSRISNEKLDDVLNKAEEISNIADDLGLYAPELETVAPAAD